MPFNPFHFNSDEIVGFILVLMRVASIFLTAPFFASGNIPSPIKASWILIISCLIFPVVHIDQDKMPIIGLPFVFAIVREILVGVSIGLGAYLIFTGIQLAGQIIDMQMGLGMVNIIDPISNIQVSVIGQFYYLVATLIFLAADGHLLLLKSLVESFNIIPLATANFSPVLGEKIMEMFSQTFEIAFQIGAPTIGALFITNIILGIVSRTIPQMNVFVVGMPLNLAVGFLVVAISMGVFALVVSSLFNTDGMYHDLIIIENTMR